MDKIRKSHITATVIAVVTMGIASGSALAGGFLDVEFHSYNFGASTDINNDHWPLAPGGAARTFIYLGETEDGCVFDKVESKPALSKTFANSPYDLVTPMVVVDREWETDMECDAIRDVLESNNEWEPLEGLGELTHDWYAQDNFKNIWYMGELSRSFDEEDGCDEGEFDPTTPTNTDEECYEGSWEAGVTAGDPEEPDEAVTGEPGIVVPSDMPFGPDGEPLSSGTYYFQEIAFEAEDMAKVLRLSAPLDDYENCRKVKEWNPYEPGESVEHKWYCRDGAGLVLIEGIGGGPTEVEDLVLIFTPGP